MQKQSYCPCGAPLNNPKRVYCSRSCMGDAQRISDEEFWSRVDRRGDDECWVWTRYCLPNGYGRVGNDYAHRRALAIHMGRPVATGMYVLHSCDNRPCCNPAHLREGTHADNMADAVERRRNVVPNPRQGRKLTWRDVDAIRALREDGLSQPKIAAQFGISHIMVGKIVRHECWHEEHRDAYPV